MSLDALVRFLASHLYGDLTACSQGRWQVPNSCLLVVLLFSWLSFCVRRTGQTVTALHVVVFLLSVIRSVELLSNPRGEKEFIRFHLFFFHSWMLSFSSFLTLFLGEMCEEWTFRKKYYLLQFPHDAGFHLLHAPAAKCHCRRGAGC